MTHNYRNIALRLRGQNGCIDALRLFRSWLLVTIVKFGRAGFHHLFNRTPQALDLERTDMCVNLRGLHTLMSEEVLNVPKVGPLLQHVCRKSMP